MINRDPHTDPSVANPDVRLQGVQFVENDGAMYGDHIKNTAAICNSSTWHTYGNVMAVVEQFLLSKFPKDLFNTVTVSTTLASEQLRHLPNKLQKVEMPVMVLVPRPSFGQDDNRFLAHTQMNARFTNTHSIWGEGSLIPLAYDMQNRLWIHGKYNRAVMYVDVVLNFNTLGEQMEYMSWIHNMIPVGHNQFIRAPLELYIPEEFCELVSNIVNIPVSETLNGNKSVYKFSRYLNSIWDNPITYKLDGGSNSNEFFMYYIADIDVLIDIPQAGAGIKDGQIKRNFEIAFTVRCEFNTVGYFTLNSPEFKTQMNIESKGGNYSVVPMFSDVINLDDFELPQGWSVLSWPIFTLKIGANSISFDNVLNESLRAAIDHHLQFRIPMERFIQIQFRENGQILNNEMFFIDWTHRTITLTKPDPHRTYRLIITTSVEYVNNLISQLFNLE